MAIKVPDNLSNAPAAFAGVVRRVNFLLRMARLVAGMKGAGSVKVDVSDENIVISGTGGGEFNGTVGICINGVPHYINIAYDAERGAYPVEDGADYPITHE